jgi:hypothetical protein
MTAGNGIRGPHPPQPPSPDNRRGWRLCYRERGELFGAVWGSVFRGAA